MGIPEETGVPAETGIPKETGVPVELERRIASWEALSRWERSQVGRDLRRLGLSYGEIRRLIDVKKSTLATWCRDIDLSETQKQAILQRTGSRRGIPVDTQWRRREEVKRLQERAREQARKLLDDPFWVAGVVLYWAEGGKTNRRLELAHTEPPALILYRKWARDFHHPTAQFRASINLHADNDEGQARQWWANRLGLDPIDDFTKSFIKPDGTGHRKNHLPHGTCRLSMRSSTDAWLRTLVWIDVVRKVVIDYPGLWAAGATGSAVDS